ncbi:MAG: hypothetical protein L0Y57_06400 [Beijerinckiaceae bacterium]|nr:hypothetical protein [Beijerinckiaceae bacterium]
MPGPSRFKTIVALASLAALPIAFGASFAEARGAGAALQAKPPETAYTGRGAASLSYSRTLPLQPRHEIIAEQKPIQVSVTNASTLVEQLQSQLAAQQDATISLHWRITRPRVH